MFSTDDLIPQSVIVRFTTRRYSEKEYHRHSFSRAQSLCEIRSVDGHLLFHGDTHECHAFLKLFGFESVPGSGGCWVKVTHSAEHRRLLGRLTGRTTGSLASAFGMRGFR